MFASYMMTSTCVSLHLQCVCREVCCLAVADARFLGLEEVGLSLIHELWMLFLLRLCYVHGPLGEPPHKYDAVSAAGFRMGRGRQQELSSLVLRAYIDLR